MSVTSPQWTAGYLPPVLRKRAMDVIPIIWEFLYVTPDGVNGCLLCGWSLTTDCYGYTLPNHCTCTYWDCTMDHTEYDPFQYCSYLCAIYHDLRGNYRKFLLRKPLTHLRKKRLGIWFHNNCMLNGLWISLDRKESRFRDFRLAFLGEDDTIMDVKFLFDD